MTLEKTGYLATEIDGKLVIPEKKIQEEWQPAVDEVVSVIKSWFSVSYLHSIYLRGSVGQGCAIKDVSDMDFYCIGKWQERFKKVKKP